MYGAQSLKARAAKCALTAGLAAGLFQPFLPRLESDLDGAGGGAFLADYLKEILGRRDLDFAISLGTPGAHRKPVIQVLEAGGMALAYAKIGWNEATCELVGNEAEVLRRMAGADLPGLSLPNLLHQGRWQGRLVCLQSPAPRGATRAGRDLDSGYLGALHDLAAIESRPLPLGESPFWASLRRWVGLLPGAGYGGGLSALLERVPRRLREEQLPCRFCHGDFVPWNALRFNGRPFLFDWEYARWQWLPGYDLFHFLFQSRLLLTREPPASIFRDVLAQATTSEALRLYWRRLEIPGPSLRPLMLLYLLERAVRLAVENPEHYPALRRVLALLELGCAELGWLP